MKTIQPTSPIRCLVFMILAVLVASCAYTADAAVKTPANKKKLKIVFLLGQSNMVGHSDARTAWYLTQPMYVPPREAALARSRYFDGSFYWQGMSYAYGSEEFNARGKALLKERRASRTRWRELVYGNTQGRRNDWLAEYGPMPKPGTKTMYPERYQMKLHPTQTILSPDQLLRHGLRT